LKNYEIILNTIKKRRSVRSFIRDFEIGDDVLMKILEAAKHIPSARNIQPLEFIIVRDKNILESLNTACQQNQTSQVDVAIVIVGDLILARKVGSISSHSYTTADKGSNIFIFMDAAASAQNILLAACSLGIDTLWISSFDEKEISRVLNIPETYIPLVIIPLGKRKNEPFTPQKRPLIERIHHDTFQVINHDFSYLEMSKKINEDNGELQNYTHVNLQTARKELTKLLAANCNTKQSEEFLHYANSIAKKCKLISEQINKRNSLPVSPSKLEAIGLLCRIGLILSDNIEYEELYCFDYLNKNGFSTISNIIVSPVIGLEKISFYVSKTSIEIGNIRNYAIDSVEKKILTFVLLSTNSDGGDIYFGDKINELESNCSNIVIKSMYNKKRNELTEICLEIETLVNK